jgi:hypothetical protein
VTHITIELQTGLKIHKKVRNNKVMLTVFLNEYLVCKYDAFYLYLQALQLFMLIIDFMCLAGLKSLLWLHWKHDFT